MLVISYVPLLYAEPIIKTAESTKEIIENIEPHLRMVEAENLGGALGCLWEYNHGTIKLSFLLKRGTEIHNHLMAWCEYQSSMWFQLSLSQKNNFYAVGLIPNFKLSIERMKFNAAVLYPTGEYKEEVEFKSHQFIFIPIRYYGEVGEGAKGVKKANKGWPKRGSEVEVSIVDMDGDRITDLEGMRENRLVIGNIKVNIGQSEEYTKSILDNG